VPLRLIVGLGFFEHGYAKLARDAEGIIGILDAIGMPFAHFGEPGYETDLLMGRPCWHCAWGHRSVVNRSLSDLSAAMMRWNLNPTRWCSRHWPPVRRASTLSRSASAGRRFCRAIGSPFVAPSLLREQLPAVCRVWIATGCAAMTPVAQS
jgi:hypothetical protein